MSVKPTPDTRHPTPLMCIIALDLGTSSFKAAVVDEIQVYGRPTIVKYDVEYTDEGVTCPPERYYQAALKAIRGAVRTARELGLIVQAIGISSQAQTFVALDAAGKTVQPAVVWTDAMAVEESELARKALPNYATTSGFLEPSPLQFLPKVMRFQRLGGKANKFLLLNEWIIYRLTGEAYGDEINQGMGGFYDIAKRDWHKSALELASNQQNGCPIGQDNFAITGPAAGIGAKLKPDIARKLGLPEIPVYSCGNDQSCAAIGAGLQNEDDIFCNFGTAMVIYSVKNNPAAPGKANQIAGISPICSGEQLDKPISSSRARNSNELRGQWFLLGLEAEFGNVLDWLALMLYPRRGTAYMIDMALNENLASSLQPEVILKAGGLIDLRNLRVGSQPEHLARAFLEFYAGRFEEMLADISKPGKYRLFAGGGLSQNEAWLSLLSNRCGVEFERTACEHPGLVGIARIIKHREK